MTDEERPFELIQPHRDVLRDIRQMQENLAELESAVKDAEWLTLGGRGFVDLDHVDNLCEAVEGSMPFIQDAIHDLPGTPESERGSDD